MDDPNANADQKENEAVVHKKLLNKYIQIVTRKEPKGRYSYSEVEKWRTEVLTLSTEDLKQRIREMSSLDFVNAPYDEVDVVRGPMLRLIEGASQFRPQVRYFFDKEKGPGVLKLFWPGKDGDRRIAKRIANIDFRKFCPGCWIRLTSISVKECIRYVRYSRVIGQTALTPFT